MKELIASTFYSEGPGSLNSTGGKEPVIQTAVTDEEIRSFVTIFRRLYMVSEPAGFLKAVDAFVSSVPGFPLTEWVKGCAGDYAKMLDSPPDSIPFDWAKNVSFTRKNLIDVFIYTQYAHQPSADRLRQFNRYLNEVGNRKSLLSYLFLSELCGCTHKMSCAGKVIANFFDSYCRSQGVSTEIVDSLLKENPGVGKLGKKRDQENRLIREKTEEIAFKLWQERGRPSGGPVLFYDEARKRLATLMEEGLT
jgi:hypothetical protein